MKVNKQEVIIYFPKTFILVVLSQFKLLCYGYVLQKCHNGVST